MLDYILGIKMDGKQAVGEANRVEGSLSQIGSAVKKISGLFGAAFIARGLARTYKEITDFGSEVQNLSKRMDVSTDKVQEWQYAAAQTGTTIEALANGMRFVQQRMTEAEDGMSEATAAFDFFRFSVADLQKMRPEQVLEEIASRFQAMPASARKTDAAITLLGRSADQLFVAFREGFKAATEEARKFNLVMDQDTIKQLDAAADKLVTFQQQWKFLMAETVTGAGDASVAMDRLNAGLLEFRKRGGISLLVKPTIPNLIGIGGAIRGVDRREPSKMNVEAIGKHTELLQKQLNELEELNRTTKEVL